MNKNIRRNCYEPGEIIFGIQSPGADWIKLDGTTQKVSSELASKLATPAATVNAPKSAFASLAGVIEPSAGA